MTESIEERIARVTFNDDGLVAAIIQQWDTHEVLMLGWMDAEALRRTLGEGRVTFWSRSRQEYWRKGDTSGHIQLVRGARLDCDGDAVLVTVEQVGPGMPHRHPHVLRRRRPDARARPRGCRVMRRARLLAVVAAVAVGALGVISSTQTWLWVMLEDGGSALAVPGASAIAVLAPLSLAVLALGVALSIVGPVLRYVFGALSVAIAALLAWLTAQVAFLHPTSAVASTVTEATGISGEDAVDALVAQVDATAWPYVSLVAWIVLLAAGVFTLATAHRLAGERAPVSHGCRHPCRDHHGDDVTPARRHRLVG